MTYTRVVFWKSFVFFYFILNLVNPKAIWGQVRPRILQRVDNEKRVTLKGNVHPMAVVQNDRGAVSDAQPVGRIVLLLKRSDEQQSALSSFMEQQQDKSSPNYHHWLAPAEFGAQYGIADADIQAVTQWLTQQGFQVNQVYSSKMEIEFSGNAAQVRSTFGTDLRNFQVDGKTYMANSADPQIPAALAPVIAGIVSLNNFPRQSYARRLGQFRREKGHSLVKPLVTVPFGSGNFYPLGPADFATIYNSAPLIAASNDGTGQTIAIVGETNISLADVQNFRQLFGLPATFTAANIILNGEDPGITSLDEESEADLDVQWSGAVAPGATVKFVVSASTPASAGIDLSALYIIEHNLAGVMSESYGACEQAIGAAGNGFYNAIWEQAAAQGITVALSSGDGGSAGCDNFNSESAATIGLSVSGFASTPFNVAVGGTDFDQLNQQSTFWNPTNDPTTGRSAKGYIPEIPWNQSCAQMGLTACISPQPQYQNIVAGSGGPSSRYSKPTWQMGVTGMPNDSKRDLPDISLLASPGFDGTGYIVCQQDVNSGQTCDLNGFFDFSIIGGTSASSPSFAGVMALVNQYQAAHGGSPRQGNANYVLYALAKKSGASCTSAVGEAAGCIFNDVTHGNSGFTGNVGTNSVPCQGKTPNCSVATGTNVGVLVDSSKNEAWTTNAGYDMVTGLGSLNVQNLAQNWGSVSTVATTTTLTLTPTTGITHGTTENVAVGITVTPASGTPTGVVSLIANLPDGSTRGIDNFTIANGVITGAKTKNLPGGTYTVTAHYAGDGTNAPSDSAPVSVTVAPESSQTFVVIPTFDSVGQQTNGNGSTVTYGGSYIIRMYVTDKTGTLNANGAPGSTCDQTDRFICPTGTVTLASGGNPVDQGTFSLNSAGYTRDIVPILQGGTYSLVATYGGDSSFNTSFSAAHALTVAPVSAQINGPFTNISTPGPVLIGTAIILSVVINTPVYNGAAPTGTVTFYDGSTVLPGTVVFTPTPGSANVTASLNASLSVTFASTGPHVITAKYGGDANYVPAVSSSTTLNLFYPTTITETTPTPSINYGQSITFTATVVSTNKSPAMTGVIYFYPYSNGGSQPGSTPVAGTDANGIQTLTSTFTYTPQGPDFILTSYSGDQNYEPTQSNLQSINVNIPDFNMPQNLSLTVTAGQTGTATIQVTPASNTASAVAFSFSGGGATPFPGAMLSAAPSNINLNGAPVPVTISLMTVAPSTGPQAISHEQIRKSGFLVSSRDGWSSIAATSGVVLLFLLGFPGRRKRYRAAFLVGLVCGISFAIGCGGGGGNPGSGGGGGGVTITPVDSTTTLSTPMTKLAANTPFVLTANVTSSATNRPTGTVTFAQNGAPISNALPLANGQVSFQVQTGLGAYAYTAQYSGDTYNHPSRSASPLNVVGTGSMLVLFSGQTGTLDHSTQLTLTLQ